MNPAEFQASNPYASFGGIVSDAPATERLAFMKRTYLHLAMAVYALVALEWVYFQVVPEAWITAIFSMRWGMLIMFGAFMLVSTIAERWARSSTSIGMQYAGLLTYVLAQSIILCPILWFASDMTISLAGAGTFSTIGVAAVATLVIFAALTAAVLLTKKDFSFLGPALSIAGIASFALIVIGAIAGFHLGLFFSVAMVALASGYILYETSNVMHHYRTTQHVAASLALFASVALLFWYILRIVMAFSSRD